MSVGKKLNGKSSTKQLQKVGKQQSKQGYPGDSYGKQDVGAPFLRLENTFLKGTI